jgi:hypothetical protein
MDEHPDGAAVAGVPEGLPVLDVGRHRRPEHGACVMEYVSVLAGERWSDSPACTDRALGGLARRVNDDVGPQARSALSRIAPHLVGTAGPHVATDVVIAAVLRVALESAPDDEVLIRMRRRLGARSRAGAAPGAGVRAWSVRWWRVITGPGLGGAYLQFVRVVSGLPRDEQDAVRVRALAAATEDVSRHLGLRAAFPSHVIQPMVAAEPGPVDQPASTLR